MKEQTTVADAHLYLGHICWTIKEIRKGDDVLAAGMEATLQRCDGGTCTIYARCACCGTTRYYHGVELSALIFDIPDYVQRDREEKALKEKLKYEARQARNAKDPAIEAQKARLKQEAAERRALREEQKLLKQQVALQKTIDALNAKQKQASTYQQ